jgi:hypothetical protein
MLQTIPTPTARKYPRPQAVPPPVTLCAWVKNPFKMFETDPAYLRAEIHSINGQAVTVCEWQSVNIFTVRMSDVRKVHTITEAGEVWRIYGNPPAAIKEN